VIVTSVERVRRRRRVNIFVDGEFAIALGVDLATECDVRPGREVSTAHLRALADEDARREALQSALRFLSYRPRSEQELRQRLVRKGLPRAAIAAAMSRVRELGYLDDAAFARFWTETRQASRPRARRVVAGELRRRGIAAEQVEEATAEIEDEAAAYEAAGRRVRSLRGLEYQPFRERLGRFLTSRGFSYEVARRTIDRCWRDISEESAAETSNANALT
jgi:regulatory protein